MIMQYPMVGSSAAVASGGVTTVDCQNQVRSWRLLRSLMELLIPRCNCTFIEENNHDHHFKQDKKCTTTTTTTQIPSHYTKPRFISSTTITGTIFGTPRGKANFCIQTNPKRSTSTPLILLLELALPTATLAREMKEGVLRISLECNNACGNYKNGSTPSLLSIPLWTMFCNGRKIGFAVKRRPSKSNMAALHVMESVVVGAGTISRKELKIISTGDDDDDDLLYLRGKFERVKGSSNSESFHLMDPDGNVGQELSFFFLRSN